MSDRTPPKAPDAIDVITAEPFAAPPDIIETISMKMAYMPEALRQIAEFVVAQPETSKNMTISDLAREVGVADSTVTRFVKAIDLDRFHDLKIALAVHRTAKQAGQGAGAAYVYTGIAPSDGTQTVLDKVTHQASSALARARRSVDTSAIDRAVAALADADVIWFQAQGSSALAAYEGQIRFTRAGKRCMYYSDQTLQQMSSAILGPTDVVVAISHSGRSQVVVECVARARAEGATTLAITAFPDSPLSKSADLVLFTDAVARGNVGEHGEEVSSKWAQLLVIDTIYARYAAQHADESADALERTHRAGIEPSRMG